MPIRIYVSIMDSAMREKMPLENVKKQNLEN